MNERINFKDIHDKILERINAHSKDVVSNETSKQIFEVIKITSALAATTAIETYHSQLHPEDK